MKPPIVSSDWPADIRALHEHDLREIWDPRIARHIWNQYHNQLQIYMSLAGDRTSLDVLDVGCAQATLGMLLAEQGHRVQVMDIRPQFLEYARSRYERGDIRFIEGNAMDWEPDRSFDLVFANQIVEHLVRPLEFTTRLASWLKPGGRLVMTTPNWRYVKNSLPSFTELGDAEQYLHREFSADADGHFFSYRPDELRAVFRAAGLDEVTVRYFETPWINGHMKVRHIHEVAPAWLLGVLDRVTLAVPGVGARLAHQLMVMGTRS